MMQERRCDFEAPAPCGCTVLWTHVAAWNEIRSKYEYTYEIGRCGCE